jgi:hypothetical protein
VVDTFTNNFDFTLMTTGGDSGTWGGIANNTIFSPLDAILGGTQAITLSSTNVTLTQTQWNNKAFVLSGTLLANVNLILPLSVNASGGAPSVGGEFIVFNACTGAFTVTVKSQIAATSTAVVPQGRAMVLWADSSSGNVLYANAGYNLTSDFWTTLNANIAIENFIDGQGSVITAGPHGFADIPFNCNINAWTVVSDANGLACDIWRANGAKPTSSAQSIVGGGTQPQSSGSTYAHAAPSGWTSTSLVKGDALVFNVTGAAVIQQCLISLWATRTSS